MRGGNTHSSYSIMTRAVACAGLLAGAVLSVGCDPAAPIAAGDGSGSPTAAPGGTATAETGPIVRFNVPSQSMTVRDDQVATLEFTVDTASEATVSLFLDTDSNADNGNEIDLAAGKAYQPGVTSATVELIAGFHPYATYFVKARATDGTHTTVYSAAGIVNIVPGGSGFGSDDGEGVATGLQLLYDSGKPLSINRRIPFVDTWHIIDVLDNLAPRLVMPVEFDTDIELHRLQFYVFGIDEPRDKRLEIYQGTDENSVGELIHQLDLTEHVSRRNGWWNTVQPDSPITLPAGKYGFSFHSALEFTEHWAGNAPQGAGYVWVSPVNTAAFSKASLDEFGFVPNFGIRLVGKFVGKDAGGARARLPDREAEAIDVARGKMETGDYLEDQKIYQYQREKPARSIHIVWRRASAIDR